MKARFLIFVCFVFFGWNSVFAKEYSSLNRGVRDELEKAMLEFIPDYADSMTSVLQDIFRLSEQNITQDTWLDEVVYKDAKGFAEILQSHQPTKLKDHRFADATSVTLAEFLGAAGNATMLTTILKEKKEMQPDVFEERHSSTLNAMIQVNESDATSASIWLSGLARPYCGIQVELTYSRSKSGIKVKSINAYEDCD